MKYLILNISFQRFILLEIFVHGVIIVFLQTAHGINMGLPQVLLTSTTNELVFNDLFSLREVSQVSFFLCIGFELEMQTFKDSIIYQIECFYLDSGLR